MAEPETWSIQTRWRASYWLLSILLLLTSALFAVKRTFDGDYWEHAATVRAIAANPLRPSNPMVALNAPHAFVSPYLMAVGLTARLLSCDSRTTLSWAGVLNLACFLASFRIFTSRLAGERYDVSCLALVAVLFLWGADPWQWSGFFHFKSIVYVAPYPSTAGATLLFLSIALAYDLERSENKLARALLLGLSVSAATIVHPLTAVSLLAGLGAISAVSIIGARMPRGQLLWLPASVLSGLGLSLAWPYFPLFDLFMNQADLVDTDSSVLYHQVLQRTWPLLLLTALFAWRGRGVLRSETWAWLLLLVLLYALGWARWPRLGRVISSIAILVQIGTASAVGQWLRMARENVARAAPATVLILSIALAAFSGGASLMSILRSPPRAFDLELLVPLVAEQDVVLADGWNSFMLPAFAGKAVSSIHPLYWVSDSGERRLAVLRFWDESTGQSAREKILDRYSVRFVLARAGLQGKIAGSLPRLQFAAARGDLVLYRVLQDS